MSTVESLVGRWLEEADEMEARGQATGGAAYMRAEADKLRARADELEAAIASPAGEGGPKYSWGADGTVLADFTDDPGYWTAPEQPGSAVQGEDGVDTINAATLSDAADDPALGLPEARAMLRDASGLIRRLATTAGSVQGEARAIKWPPRAMRGDYGVTLRDGREFLPLNAVERLVIDEAGTWNRCLDECQRAYKEATQPAPATAGVQGEAAADYAPGELDRTAPARVWLQIDTSASNDERDDPWPGAEHVTWQDESIGGLEIQYVRADLATTPPPAPAAEPVLVDGVIVDLGVLIDACDKLNSLNPTWPVSRERFIKWRTALTAALAQPHAAQDAG